MKLLAVFFLIIFVFYFFLFSQRVWFHYDDFDFLLGSANFSLNYLFQPHNEHLLPLFKAVFFLQYSLFGLHFMPYFVVLICLHLFNLFVVWLIVRQLTRNRLFAYIAVILLAVNVSYIEVVLWATSLQMMFCSLFIGLAFLSWFTFRQKNSRGYLWMAGLASVLAALSQGIGLAYPFVLATLSFIDRKTGRKVGLFFSLIGLVMVSIFLYLAHQNLDIVQNETITPLTLPKIGMFLYIGLKKALFIRFFYPLFTLSYLGLGILHKRLLTFVAGILLLLLFIRSSPKNKDKFFLKVALLIHLIYPYAFISLKRAAISPGLALADRYTYIPLFFLVILFVYLLAGLRQTVWLKIFSLFFTAYIISSQIFAFYYRARLWTQQPLLSKEFFRQLAQKAQGNDLGPECKTPKSLNGRSESCLKYKKLLRYLP